MPRTYQVVDLFAGPGGLAEGFSAFLDSEGNRPFNVTLSVEKDAAAHQTLRLRAFLRQFDEFPDEYYETLNAGRPLPDWAKLYSGEWETAEEEALQLTLGEDRAAKIIGRRLDELLRLDVETVLIGGPPCQAYSLVGRARNQGKTDYKPEKDHRHFLYKEYISILQKLRPVAFVMENVKGMLSSSVSGERIFEQVLSDLREAGGDADSYELFALTVDAERRPMLWRTLKPSHFVLHAEDFGVAQARHRVIIVGLRADKARNIASNLQTAGEKADEPATVRHVIEAMPRLRSKLSQDDSFSNWRQAVLEQMQAAVDAMRDMGATSDVLALAKREMAEFRASEEVLFSTSSEKAGIADDCPTPLAEWIEDERLEVTLNHASRSHMAADFSRYFFCSAFAAVRARSPKAREFPAGLAPEHQSWSSGIFADRFRTQCWNDPSTTITSHISKDGHYFIHPDTSQCRSLTVREAARLQSFPDNYIFLGNRTQQYVQVGNAVPPFLAHQIAEVVWRSLGLDQAKSSLGDSGHSRETVALQD